MSKMNRRDRHIENIYNLIGTFQKKGDLDPYQMFSLIVSKKFILEYGIEYPLQKPNLEKVLEKINEIKKEYYKNLPTMSEWFKQILRENKLTIKQAEVSLNNFIQVMTGIFKNPREFIKTRLFILEQQLLGRYEDEYYQNE